MGLYSLDTDLPVERGSAGWPVMSTSLEVRIWRLNNSLAFEFSREISFDFFVISNAEEHVFGS
jgi:hypothetical protein